LLEGAATQGEIDAVRTDIAKIVEQAYSQAMADPLPPEASAFEHMFA